MKNTAYVFLSLIFLLLAGGGVYYLVFINPQPSFISKIPQLNLPSTPTPEVLPTDIPQETPIETPIATIAATATVTVTKIPTNTKTPTVTIAEATPTPMSSIFTSTDDNFTVTYLSHRRVYQDKDSNGGNRYTFSIPGSNFPFTIHIGTDWSWKHPDRNFSGDYLVAGLNTFRYLITSQTITDFEKDGKKYTIQCLHNGDSVLKEECESFTQAFKII